MAVTRKVGRQRMVGEVHMAPAPPPQKGSWKPAVAVVLLLGLVWFLPAIVARTPLLAWGLRTAAHVDGVVSVQSASLGWLAPVVLSGVEIDDAKRQPLLEADRLSSGKTLLAMLTNPHGVISLRVDHPKLNLLVHEHGSNIETILAHWLVATGPSSSANVALEVVDGSVTIVDQETRQNWLIDKLQLTVSTSADYALPTKIEASAAIADLKRPGSLKLTWRTLGSDATAKTASSPRGLDQTDGELDFQADSVPLAMFQRLAARLLPETTLAGVLGSKIQVRWTGPTQLGVESDVAVSDLVVASPAAGGPLGKDVVRLDRLHAACVALRRDGHVEIQRAAIESDVENVAAVGSIELGDRGLAGLRNALARPTCNVQGQIDLARLARMLPGTLRIRPGVEITSGQVQLAIQSGSGSAAGPSGAPAANAGAGMVWRAQLETSRLTATDRGRQLAWERPIRIALAAHEAAAQPSMAGVIVDGAQCDSDFLKINAAGTVDKLAASISVDLKQLVDRLGQFVDLGGMTLAGDGWGNIHWNRSPERNFEADGDLQLRNVRVALGTQPPWVESNVAMTASARGAADFGDVARVDSAGLQVRSSAGQLDLELAEPIRNLWSLGGTLIGFNTRLKSDVASAQLKSQVIQTADRRDVQLSGDLGYDWPRLCELLRAHFGGSIQIVGQGSCPVQYQGPLWPPTGQGSLALRWASANVYGFQLGPGEWKVRLADGLLQPEPLRVACNQGQLILAPQVRMTPGPMAIVLPPGPVVQRVELDPAKSQAALMYALPILASVTTVRGSFSAEMDGGRIPLDDPAKSEASGRLIIHAAEIGPGPLLGQLSVLLASQPTLAKIKPDSVVQVRMVGGRIYHQGLEIQFPELTIRTYGSVGLDQSLAIMAEMSVPPKWLGGTSLGDGLKDQVVRIPITGTLGRPQIDQRELALQSARFVRNAATSVLQHDVGSQLNRLFGSGK